MPVIEAVKEIIVDYRTTEMFDKCMEKVEALTSTSEDHGDSARPIRNRRRSTRLNDFVIEESIGERGEEDDEIRSLFHEVIDVTLAEFDARFTENNEILLALSNSPNIELVELKPLEKLGLILPSEHEMKTAKKYVENKRKEWNDASEEGDRFNILSVLYEIREAFPEVYKLFASIDTFACSTAVCESSFSALSRIDIPSRLSMNNDRMRNLAFLAFENKRLENISIDDVLKEFDQRKQRKVQLY